MTRTLYTCNTCGRPTCIATININNTVTIDAGAGAEARIPVALFDRTRCAFDPTQTKRGEFR